MKNHFVGIEHLTDKEIEGLREACEAHAKKDGDRAVRAVGKRAEEAADAAGS